MQFNPEKPAVYQTEIKLIEEGKPATITVELPLSIAYLLAAYYGMKDSKKCKNGYPDQLKNIEKDLHDFGKKLNIFMRENNIPRNVKFIDSSDNMITPDMFETNGNSF